jgi:hypothetical protein
MSIHDPKTGPDTVANTRVDRRGDLDPIQSEPGGLRQYFEQPVLRAHEGGQHVSRDIRPQDGRRGSADSRRRFQSPVENGAGEIHSERTPVLNEASGTGCRKGGGPRGKVHFGGNCQMYQAFSGRPRTGLGARGESGLAGPRYQAFGALRVQAELLAQVGELGVHIGALQFSSFKQRLQLPVVAFLLAQHDRAEQPPCNAGNCQLACYRGSRSRRSEGKHG